jgi:hypothetical protein
LISHLRKLILLIEKYSKMSMIDYHPYDKH